jgi:hypothetical protein
MATSPKIRLVPEIDKQMAELELQHGPCCRIVNGGKLYVFRTPTADEWEQYQDNLTKEGRPRNATFKELAQVTCVTDLQELQELIAKKPAVTVPIANAVCALAGIDIEVSVKKD